jgi:hypothetical protein
MKVSTYLLAGLLAACGGVGGAVDGESGGDELRDRANGFFVDRGSVTDRLNGDGGDNTDWKYVDVNDPGRVSISVVFDSPDSLSGARVTLHDEFGERLDQRVVSPSTGSGYRFDTEVQKVPNKFYVRVFTREGTSAYSIGARLAYAPRPAPPQPIAQPAAAPEPVVAERPRKRKRRARKKKVAAPKAAPKPIAKPAKVRGKIVRMSPGSGYVLLTVRLPAGATVPKSSRAKVFKDGAAQGWGVSIVKVQGSNVTVKVRQSAGHFTGKLSVFFYVR